MTNNRENSATCQHWVMQQTLGHPEQSGVIPIVSGADAFTMRLAMIKAAQQSIDLQYYIYHPDDTGRQLTLALLDAADRGVHVRMLLDDMNASKKDPGMILLEQHPLIEVRLFNPFAFRYLKGVTLMYELRRINRRMHNKSLTVDRCMTLVGGRNIGDEYFDAHETINFGDLDLLAIGNVVADVTGQFEQYWQATAVFPVATFLKQTLSVTELAEKRETMFQRIRKRVESPPPLSQLLQEEPFTLRWGQAEAWFDQPEKVTSTATRPQQVLDNILASFAQIKEKLVLVTPYFVPGKRGCSELAKLVKRGVDVTVITNSLAATDVIAVHSGYKRYRRRLLKAGIKLYEMKVDPDNKPNQWRGARRASLHAKTFSIDGKQLFVGSFNFDPRSVSFNTELGIFFDAPALSQSLFKGMQDRLELASYRLSLGSHRRLKWHDDAHNETLVHEPDCSIGRRLLAKILAMVNLERFL